ncbi:MAG: ABC transporter permease, partial [Nocardioides sp.]|nr:ABC transporter permease [Nocardioides sp.]
MSAAGNLPVAPVEATLVGHSDEDTRRRGPAGYLLMVPGGLWLVLFFVVPTVTLVSTSLYDPSGSLALGYQMTGHWQNYTQSLSDYSPQIIRSFLYALMATGACVVLGFPLAYAIAFKAGRWKYVMLVAVIAPFFTSFLVRTLAWQYLLGDNELLVSILRKVHILGSDGYLLDTPFAVVTGLTYGFLPFMVL